VTFVFVNLGPALEEVNISPTFSPPLSLYRYQQKPYLEVPYWGQGEALNFTVFVDVNPYAVDGVYQENFTVSSPTSSLIASVEVPITGYVEFSAQAFWGSASSPLVVAPGERIQPLTILLLNDGNSPATQVYITVNSSYPLRFYSSEVEVGNIPPGQPVPVTLYADVYPNASPGVYQVPINVHYFGDSLERVEVQVPIVGYVNVSARSYWGSPTSPIYVSAGETSVPLTFLVTNDGPVELSNVSLEAYSSFPVRFTVRSTVIGFLPPGQPVPVTLYADVYPNASPGVYDVNLKLRYFSGDSMTLSSPVIIGGPNLTINYALLPPQVFPGFQDVQLRVILANTGLAPAVGLNVSISSPFQVVSPSLVSFGILAPGGTVDPTFLLNFPRTTEPGVYHLNLTLRFDGGLVHYSIPLRVYPEANFTILKVVYPSLASGKSQVPLTFELKNTGNVSAENLLVRLNPSDVIYPYVSSSNPLGALSASLNGLGEVGPGQEINVTFVVDVSSGISPGTYPVSLTLVWNQSGSPYPIFQSRTVNLNVSEPFTVQVLKELTTINLVSVVVYDLILVAIIVGIVVAVVRSRRTG
jgi:hypothetical protein